MGEFGDIDTKIYILLGSALRALIANAAILVAMLAAGVVVSVVYRNRIWIASEVGRIYGAYEAERVRAMGRARAFGEGANREQNQ